MRSTYHIALMASLLLLLLNGCSVLPEESSSSSGPAADTLLAQADIKAASGEIQQAIATLERAVRLQPRNGQAWLRLAELYHQQGDNHKAKQFAGRAQQFSAGNRTLQRRIESLLEQLREQPQPLG